MSEAPSRHEIISGWENMDSTLENYSGYAKEAIGEIHNAVCDNKIGRTTVDEYLKLVARAGDLGLDLFIPGEKELPFPGAIEWIKRCEQKAQAKTLPKLFFG